MQAEDHVDYDALFDAAFDAPSVKAVIEGKVVVPVETAASTTTSASRKKAVLDDDTDDITPEREQLSQQRRPSVGSPASSADAVKEKRRLSLSSAAASTSPTSSSTPSPPAAAATTTAAAATATPLAAAPAKKDKTTPMSAAGKAKAKAAKAAPKHKCGACTKEPGTIFVPMPAAGGKQRMKALCTGCANKAVYCTKCKGLSSQFKKEDEDERCKACGWVMCDPDCKGACNTCEEGTLRPLRWRKCSRKPCGQEWAETTKWCATCGRCSLKKCAGKISVCKDPSCKQGQPPTPCSQAVGGKQRLPAKHYHCANCIKMANDIMQCPVCKRPCECSKCTSCSSGSCCNFGSAKECKHDGCKKQVCSKCHQKSKATGKYSGLCKEHHGSIKIVKVAKADPSNMGMLKRRSSSQGEAMASSNPGKKRRKCSSCEGSERAGREQFRMLRGDLFCAVCIKKQKRTPPKKEAVAKVDPATAEPAPAMATAIAAAATAEPAAVAAAAAAGALPGASSTPMATAEATQPEESQDAESSQQVASQEEDTQPQSSFEETVPQEFSQESDGGNMPRTNTLQLFDDTPTSTPTPSTPPAQTIEDGAAAPMEQNE